AVTLSHLLSPSGQEALHLATVLPIRKEEYQHVPERTMAIEQARLYLSIIEQRLLQRDQMRPEPSITTSICVDPDIAHTLVRLAETTEGAEQSSGSTQCDIIAIATRGRSESARWVIGSIAERVLTTTKLPLLLLHPQRP
nr:universal stress protein [Ktedonobacteraceae bacterium]